MTTMTGKGAKTLFIILAVFLLCNTGCANRVEINQRSLILGVAIDKPQKPEDKNLGGKQGSKPPVGEQQQGGSELGGKTVEGFLRVEPPPEDQVPRYAMTIETPIIKALGSGTNGGDGGQGESKKMVLTSTGNTIWDIERSLSLRTGRQDFYGHLKTIVISDEVAREGIRPVLDFFTRRREVQQNITLAISNGEARKVLQVVPSEEDFAALYLDAMLESLFRTGAKINTDMLEIRRDLAESGNAVLPRVRASSPTEVKAGGAAVIKNWRFIGWMSELEASGYNIATGKIIGGATTIVDPKDKTGFITLLLRGSERKFDVKIVDNKPIFFIEINSEWDIVEKGTTTPLWDIKYLNRIGNLVGLEWQRRSLAVIDKMQREFKADVFGFGGLLARKYPIYWRNVKNDWNEKSFPQAKVNITVNAKIRRTESKT